jgi:hypothetical protein
MTVRRKTKIGTIDLTPTWRAVLPIYIDAIREQRPSMKIAIEELERMANIADLYNKSIKE